MADHPHTLVNRWILIGHHMEQVCDRCGLTESQSKDCPSALRGTLDAERLARQTAEQKLASLSRAPNAYHPNPDINVEVAQEATDGAAFDLAAGIEPGWHRGNAAEEVTRLRHELTEARAMAPRWLRGFGTYELRVGRGVLGAFSVIDADTCYPLDSEGDPEPPALSIEGAARAVCARLDLPYIEVPRE